MDRHGYGSGLLGHGSYGQPLDRPGEGSTVLQMKKTFWTAKHTLMKKMGKKEDEHVVASDAELDAKLELFRQIEKSSVSLLKVIERYQSRLFILSREENFLGLFLKGQGHEDKTRAGKMMTAVGKSECLSAGQRTQLRSPLYRLYQEVETFRSRAVADTLVTVRRMEEARTEYRGALLWMKDASEELDPDTFKQMEKFRKVQGQVKQAKGKFDKYKLDVMQKVDLLAASRSNMFSHALASYQRALLAFWESTSRLMTAVSDCFVGYQYYEFSMLKELEEPSRKLVEQTAGQQSRAAAHEAIGTQQLPTAESSAKVDRPVGTGQHEKADDEPALSEIDLLIRDILASVASDVPPLRKEALLSARSAQPLPLPVPPLTSAERERQQLNSLPSLIDLGPEDAPTPGNAFMREDVFGDFQSADAESFQGGEDADTEQALLLDDVLDGSSPLPGDALGLKGDAKDGGGSNSYQDWGAVFSALPDFGRETGSEGDEEFDALLRSDSPLRSIAPSSYLPSSLLDLSASSSDDLPAVPPYSAASGHALLSAVSVAAGDVQPAATIPLPALSPLAMLGSGLSSATKEKGRSGDRPVAAGMQPAAAAAASGSKTPKKKDLSPWYDLFADLDPLSNPDAVGKKDVDTSDLA